MNYEQIRNYSSYQQYTYWTRGTNISGIIDAMLRVTTKITENYASDIIYEIEKLKDAVEKNKAFHVLLTFRENGVDDYSVLYDMSKFATIDPPAKPTLISAEESGLGVLNYCCGEYGRSEDDAAKTFVKNGAVDVYVEPRNRYEGIQHWELVHDKDGCLTVFRRVRLSMTDIPFENN